MLYLKLSAAFVHYCQQTKIKARPHIGTERLQFANNLKTLMTRRQCELKKSIL